ncbi:hypothetical protein LAV72_18475 [Lysinibacillus xylanilyticus]|uniref:hypothetical protein n=1 Tax=Lysinibacillus xylanilyticus TaxID=582475 RepID=UPI002B23EF3B|nr:hypothetical protein [Lysinibacillus xylanilyticus]MEB2301592.1 hypothetical protein [Lysinibacillus xylanilyticus]
MFDLISYVATLSANQAILLTSIILVIGGVLLYLIFVLFDNLEHTPFTELIRYRKYEVTTRTTLGEVRTFTVRAFGKINAVEKVRKKNKNGTKLTYRAIKL